MRIVEPEVSEYGVGENKKARLLEGHMAICEKVVAEVKSWGHQENRGDC